MTEWKEQSGKIIANRAWIMTEAWIIVKRYKANGIKYTFSKAMKLAWWKAKMEVSVQISVHSQMAHIKELAKLGADRLREMANDIENIDCHSIADTKRLGDIRSAMRYA